MREQLNRIISVASRRSDMIVISFILMAVVMMIIPLPTYLIDVMVGCNIAFSVLILIVAFYSVRAVDFSVLPPIILLSTLFRLSLSISTTRLILRDADAGAIIAAFGEYVIAGDVVVGIVIFLIITIAQFIVITKGAERVAEVGARFTLDAMPGKQMSIDTDLRNGDIDQIQAKMRRQNLERESQLFGAMDGAMKFVKGDAIASLVILCVNLLGGLVIGTMRHGMSFSEAINTYSLLTVGDGMISQLPALMTAVAAGIVVTRVSSDRGINLGAEILEQLGANTKVLVLCTVILFMLALVPGFPAYVFMGLALLSGAAAFGLLRKQRAIKAADESQQQGDVGNATEAGVSQQDVTHKTAADWTDSSSGRLLLCMNPALAQTLALTSLQLSLADASARAEQALGIPLPSIGFRLDPQLEPQVFSICIDGVPVSGGILHPDCVFMFGDLSVFEMLNLPAQERLTFDGKDAVWVADQHAQDLEKLGADCLSADLVLSEYLLSTQIRCAPEFLGVQETRQLLSEMEQSSPELVRQALQVVPLQRLAEILRRLLEESVCVRNLRSILETLVQIGDAASLPVLVENIRAALARHICHQYADTHRTIGAYVLSMELEQEIRSELASLSANKSNALSTGLSGKLIRGLQSVPRGSGTSRQPVLMIAADMRRFLRQHLVRHGFTIPVMAYSELVSGYVSHPLAILSADGTPEIPIQTDAMIEHDQKQAA
ncbi:type III secretion system export apparatus subunit SctV [Advenella incenata]